MRPDSRDLTIDSVLSDPLIRAVMAADRVQARDLEGLMRTVAGRIEARPASPSSAAFQLARRVCRGAPNLCYA